VRPPGAWRGDEPGGRSLLPAGFTPACGPLSLFGSGPVLDAAGAPHPWQGPDRAHPVGERRKSRRPASIGSNQSSRRWTAVPASDCRATDFVLLLLMAWSPPARKRRHRLGFNHPETTPPAIPTTPRTAPYGRPMPGYGDTITL